ncbi:MAG: HTH domain-containing protein [Ruthenibacterium lactatiformans]
MSAAALAARLGVSRQVVVGDVALLRAAGSPIVATPRGYVLGGGQRRRRALHRGMPPRPGRPAGRAVYRGGLRVRRAGCDRGAPGVRPAFGPAAGIQPL